MRKDGRRAAWLLLGGMMAGLGACSPPDLERPAQARDGFIPPEPGEVRTVPAHEVEDWTGPGGEPFHVTQRLPGDPTHLHRTIGTRDFPLTLREDDGTLIQYPCTSCHQGVTITPQRDPDAHGNLHPVHPSRIGSTCSSCHVPQAVERLTLSTGEEVTLDHAYRLCAQCHFQQVEAWAAGAHGKRLYGWSGERVIMNCADCHDPHNPTAPVRNPYPGPRLPLGGGEPE